MEEIISFVSAHWLEWVFAAVLAILSGFFKSLRDQLKQEQKKNEAVAAGVQSLLRESIVSNFNRYTEKGYCPIYAKQTMMKLYESYHNLGGNDVVTELYQKLMKMPEEKGVRV